ncbi:MAG: response regulator [Rhodospirillales bacterium]|nr:response regulator [Rhodospirillales bacterium]
MANVLIADDNERVRAILTASFEDVGCSVIEANNGSDALKAFEQSAKEIDLVVLDMDMPQIRGSECLEHIRLEKPDLPAILISGFHEHNPADLSDGNVHFLRKPFKMQDVTDLAGELIRSSQQTAEDDRT